VYAETKVEFEHFLQHDCEGVDFATTTLRLATAYGLSPRMRFDLTIADFTRQVFLERKLEVYDQETWRPYCHLNDISEAIIGVLEAPRELVAGETFNVGGSSENYTKQSIVEIITEQIEAEIVYGQGGGDPRNYKVDFDKVRTTLGFAPSQSVKAHVPQLLRALESGLYGRADALLTYYGNHDVFL
jgi:nucleoside-diphosphate-sugar epimerase